MATMNDVCRNTHQTIRWILNHIHYFGRENARVVTKQGKHSEDEATSGTNVLIIIQNMSYTYDTRVQHIAKTLTGSGYNVNVLCPRYHGDPKNITVDGVDVQYYYLPSIPDGFIGHLIEYAYSFSVISALALITRVRKHINVLHVCNPPDIFFPLGKVFQLLQSRFIYDQHDRVPKLFKVRYGDKSLWVYKLVCKVEKLTQRTADHVITTNESGRENAIIENKIPAERVSVVRNGPDLELFPEDIVYDSDGKSMEVGYIGNMNPQDGIDLLLHTAHYIKFIEGRSDIRYVLIGNGSAFEQLKNLVRELKIDDIVEFTGRMAPEQAFRRLAMSHICVQPDPKNDFNDSCTMVKTLEYMALRKPIVAFDLKETQYSCGETVLYATNNSYEEFSKQILRLVDDPELRQHLGESGRKRVCEQLLWSHSEKRLLMVYETVIVG